MIINTGNREATDWKTILNFFSKKKLMWLIRPCFYWGEGGQVCRVWLAMSLPLPYWETNLCYNPWGMGSWWSGALANNYNKHKIYAVGNVVLESPIFILYVPMKSKYSTTELPNIFRLSYLVSHKWVSYNIKHE